MTREAELGASEDIDAKTPVPVRPGSSQSASSVGPPVHSGTSAASSEASTRASSPSLQDDGFVKLPPNMWRARLNGAGYVEQNGSGTLVPSSLKSRKQNLNHIRDIQKQAAAGFSGTATDQPGVLSSGSPKRITQTCSVTNSQAEVVKMAPSGTKMTPSAPATPRSSSQSGAKIKPSAPSTPRDATQAPRPGSRLGSRPCSRAGASPP